MTRANGARTVRPTDLVALVSHDGEVYPNEALTWERLAKGEGGPHPLGNAIEQWFSFATGRYTWISVNGQAIRGMLSARRRGGGVAWEVDCLILTEPDAALMTSLVERMTADAAKAGTRRVLLRLREDSPALPLARQAGFVVSRRETVWTKHGGAAMETADPPLRQRTREDAAGLFGLYNGSVPQATRALEAATLPEWLAFAESRGFGSKAEELVLEEDGRLTGCVRYARGRSAGWVEVGARSDTRWLDALLAAGLRRVGEKRHVFVPTAEHAGGLASLLAGAGFSELMTALTLVKMIAVPIAQVEPAAVAQSAIPV